MSDRWPGFQYMISFDPPEVIRRRHEEHLASRGITNEECWIEAMVPYPPNDPDYKRGFHCGWTLRWTTYKGWQVYMQHTGCYAVIPEEEDREKQKLETLTQP